MTSKNPICRAFSIAVAPSRTATLWQNKNISWDDFTRRCGQTKRTPETVREYGRKSREERGLIKDVGGFVGGYVAGGKRKAGNVTLRSMATLDIDYGTGDVVDKVAKALPGVEAMLYTTHSHIPLDGEKRYRVIIPFSRDVKPDEYEPICRRLAERIGLEMFDATTYQLERLFYWPSTSKDGEFVARNLPGEALDPDTILETYQDYNDISAWPRAESEERHILELVDRKQRNPIAADPASKGGVIGAFCEAHTMTEGLRLFLADVYDPVAGDRYTYKNGTTYGGLRVYDDKTAWSEHNTDPARHVCANLFDLVRIHKFGHLDSGAYSRPSDMPSFKEMIKFAEDDPATRSVLARRAANRAAADFKDISAGEATEPEAAPKPERPAAPADGEGGDKPAHWTDGLKLDMKGENFASTHHNIAMFLAHEPGLAAGDLWHDEFSHRDMIGGTLPWKHGAVWSDTDDAELRVYLSKAGITGKDKIFDATAAHFNVRRKHPVKEYLDDLKWDGTPRLDTLIIRFLGAEDNALTRAMTRKHFTAAVARIYNPGCKYDFVLTLQGGEGIGKSTLCSLMTPVEEWFSDSMTTLRGDKEDMAQVQGYWLIEWGEMTQIKKSEVEQVKSFISRRIDSYRPAYGRRMEDHRRQCVFFSTTNEEFFLKGDTGNRRFWVIRCHTKATAEQKKELVEERNQLWAEAKFRYEAGEKLYLEPELEEQARARQQEFSEAELDPTDRDLDVFLEMLLPNGWETMSLKNRQLWIHSPSMLDAPGIDRRDTVTVAEFLREYLRMDPASKEYQYKAKKVAMLMAKKPGWRKEKVRKETSYGRNTTYTRIEQEEDEL